MSAFWIWNFFAFGFVLGVCVCVCACAFVKYTIWIDCHFIHVDSLNFECYVPNHWSHWDGEVCASHAHIRIITINRKIPRKNFQLLKKWIWISCNPEGTICTMWHRQLAKIAPLPVRAIILRNLKKETEKEKKTKCVSVRKARLVFVGALWTW